MNLHNFSDELELHRGNPPMPPDDRLENACIQLLSELELQTRRLTRCRNTVELEQSIITARRILILLLEFAADHCGQMAVVPFMPRVCQLRDLLHDLQALLRRGFWARVFRIRPVLQDVQSRAAIAIGELLIEVSQKLLSLVDERFESQARLLEWQASRELLVEELRQRW